MKLLLNTSSSSECWSENNEEWYFLVDVDAEFSALMSGRIEELRRIHERDRDAYKMEFWCYLGEHVTLNEAVSAFLAEGDFEGLSGREAEVWERAYDSLDLLGLCAVGELLDPDSLVNHQRTELNLVRVYTDGVSFACSPKHSDVTVRTMDIPSRYLCREGFDTQEYEGDLEAAIAARIERSSSSSVPGDEEGE